MTQPKPILPILSFMQRCKECLGNGLIRIQKHGANIYRTDDCESCKGTGVQTRKVYALREFEKWIYKTNKSGSKFWKEKTFNIPFKHYKIKKVSEITEEYAEEILTYEYGKKIAYGHFKTWLLYELQKRHNLKENDKVVIA